MLMETTNPATHAMDMFHASLGPYIIGLVSQVETYMHLFYGTTSTKDVTKHPVPVIQNTYLIKENKDSCNWIFL